MAAKLCSRWQALATWSGEISALAGRQRTATVRALEPVGRSRFRATRCGRRSAARAGWRSSSSTSRADRLQAADLQRLEFAGHDVLAARRSAPELAGAESGRPVRDGIMLDVFLSQEELAGWTAASREAVNRALHQLRAVGCLRSERRRMIVTDLDALRRYAGVSGPAP